MQDLVNHTWASVDVAQKSELRQFIIEYAVRSHSQIVPYVRNKLAKVIVDIARQDWPHDYPHFLDTVIQVGWCHTSAYACAYSVCVCVCVCVCVRVRVCACMRSSCLFSRVVQVSCFLDQLMPCDMEKKLIVLRYWAENPNLMNIIMPGSTTLHTHCSVNSKFALLYLRGQISLARTVLSSFIIILLHFCFVCGCCCCCCCSWWFLCCSCFCCCVVAIVADSVAASTRGHSVVWPTGVADAVARAARHTRGSEHGAA